MGKALRAFQSRFGRAHLNFLDRSIGLHAHREGHLVFYLAGRPSALVVRDERVEVDAGSVVAVNPWEPHTFETDDEEGMLTLTLYIDPNWYSSYRRGDHDDLLFGSRQIECAPVVCALVGKILDALEGRGVEETLDALLYELTRECYEQSWAHASHAELAERSARRISDYRVRKSLKIMNEYVTEQMDLDEVARDSGLSRPHFFKLFKRQTGVTPNLYYNVLRMEFALRELAMSDKSISDISQALSFSSQASFSRFFSYNAGFSPRNYRQAARARVLHP